MTAREVLLCMAWACVVPMTPAMAAGGGWSEPKMRAIPAGKTTMMACPEGQKLCNEHELSERTISVAAFEMSETEVTFDQWDACIADGGCLNPPSDWAYKNRPSRPPCIEGDVCQHPDDLGWGRSNRPVIHVSWNDVQLFIAWMNRKSGSHYRLPTAAEWQYAALAGASTRFPWGQALGKGHVECPACKRGTMPVASLPPNRFGLYDMIGNVSEWVSNCFPTRARGSQTCMTYMYRGGAWSYADVESMNPRAYGHAQPELRERFLGFRVARSLERPL